MGWVGGGVRLVAVPKWLLCLVLLGRMSRPTARLPVLVVGPGAMLVPSVWHQCCCWLACSDWVVACKCWQLLAIYPGGLVKARDAGPPCWFGEMPSPLIRVPRPRTWSWVGAHDIWRSARSLHAVVSSGRRGSIKEAGCNIVERCGQVLLVFASRGCSCRYLGGALGDQPHDGGIARGRANLTHRPMGADMWGMVAGFAGPPGALHSPCG